MRPPTRALLPLARWRERGPGGEGGDRATPSAKTTYATPIPCARPDNRFVQIPTQKQPLRGLSPHPQPLSPTRGEGSKTVKPRAQLLGENSADPPARSLVLRFPTVWRRVATLTLEQALPPIDQHSTQSQITYLSLTL
jgi:hypothetical protein